MAERGGVVEVIIRAKDLTASVVNRFRASIRAIDQVIRTVVKGMAAFVAGTTAMVVGLTKLAQQGEKVVAVKEAFAKITGDETAALQQLRTASQGAIADMELMSLANQAMTLGAAKSVEQFAEMVRVSRILGRAQGVDVRHALESLTIGLARQSPRILDNIGLQVQLGDATTFAARAMEQARAKAAELESGLDGTTGAGARFATTMTNAKDRLSSFVATSPLVAGFLDTLSNIVNTIVGALERQDWQLLADVFQTIGETMGDAMVFGINKSLEKVIGNGESPLLSIRGLLGSLFRGNAAEAGQNLQTDMKTFGQLFARNRAAGLFEGPIQTQAVAAVAGGGGGPVVLPGVGVTVSGGVNRTNMGGFGTMGAERLARFRGAGVVAPTLAGRLTPELADAAGGFEEASEVVVASMGAMAEAAIRGGKLTADAVTNMVARIVQSLPGVGGFAGALIGAAGGIVGALFSRGKKREPVRVSIADYEPNALSQMEKHSGPKRITTIVEQGGVEISRIERDLYSRQNRDEVVRFSPVTGSPLRGR